VFYPICGAWSSDTSAFLVGKAFGKHKFSKISPKKSIEGCIGGLIGTLLFFIIYSLCLNNLDIEQFEKDVGTMERIAAIESVESGETLLDEEESNLIKLEQRAEYTMQQKLKEHFYTNYPLLIILGLIISVISQIGDLAASAIKRYADIKDFSNLMPGHGGMLDRFDSIVFLAPIMYYTFFIIARL
jgi:phosphatidate cytidylyltransferase